MGHIPVSRAQGQLTRSWKRGRRLAFVVFTVLGVMALPAAAAQADDTWTGASSAAGNAKFLWNDATNWSAGVPTNPAGTLIFPDLGACTATACYTSSNNLGPISATGLNLTNTTAGTQYKIQGNSVSLGPGGIFDNSGHSTGNLIQVPLVLAANQTWMVGGGFGTTLYNSLSVTSAVSGAPSTLTVPFVPGAGNGSSGDLFVTSDMEVGQVTVTGSGGLHIGGPSGGGSVNGTNGNQVAINGGATLIANPSAKVGALSVGASGSGGELLLGTGTNNVGPVTLAAKNGTSPNAVSLDPSSSTQTYINSDGSTAGTNFSQLAATGPVVLGGQLILAQGPSGAVCATLSNGDVATLITATGGLTGTFANAPTNGSIISMAAVTGSCPTPPQVRINYTASSVTATVVGGTTPTATSLATPSPSPAVTNQLVTLTATVTTTTNGNVAPAGSVAFASSGTTIPNCTARPVTPTTGSSGTATCTTSFLAAGSPEALTAAFTGTTASLQGSSVSGPQTLTVNKAATATALTVSNKSPVAGGSVTYTATVTPGVGGPTNPSGTVQFRDGGNAIAGCGGRPLTAGVSSSTTTCTVTYPTGGSHSIIAGYGGDSSFTSSSSPAVPVNVQGTLPPPPPGISATTSPANGIGTGRATLNGTISTGGQSVTWKFDYGRSTGYGQSTPNQTITAGRGTVSVSAAVKRLSPNSRYHYRLVIVSPSSAAPGKDVRFTTKNTGKLVGPGGRLTVIGRTILVSEKCQSNVLCAGRFSLTTKARVGKKRKLTTVVCARAGFRIKAHRKGTARVRLSSTCLSLLKPHRRLTVTYTAQTGTGQLGQRKRITLVLR